MLPPFASAFLLFNDDVNGSVCFESAIPPPRQTFFLDAPVSMPGNKQPILGTQSKRVNPKDQWERPCRLEKDKCYSSNPCSHFRMILTYEKLMNFLVNIEIPCFVDAGNVRLSR